MCAGYGLDKLSKYGLEPMDERGSQPLLDEWMRERSGSAKITGKNALNLNPIIRADGGVRSLDLAWWWLWLDASGPVKFSAFNSRDDKLMRSWRKPFQHRALLPATWYIEKGKRFTLPDGGVFGIAAVTNTITMDDSTKLLTYSMVTRDAVGEAADTWPRMPLVLPVELHDEWLSDRQGDADLVAEAQHASTEISEAMTVG